MSKCVDAIIAFAIGDALGVASEFKSRAELLKDPITDMISSSSPNLSEGTFSDDTAMLAATLDSFNSCCRFDYDDIMRRLLKWITEGEYTATGLVFAVGKTTKKALLNFAKGVKPLECGAKGIYDNGNGSLMRILPLALYGFYSRIDEKALIRLAIELSSLTHAHHISILACYIYVRYVIYLLEGLDKRVAYQRIKELDYSCFDSQDLRAFKRILQADIGKCSNEAIRSSAYVVDTLECCLWLLLNNDNLKDVLLKAANIGEDTDTIAAIAGSMAGIIYGLDSIPASWILKLKRKDYLYGLALAFEQNMNMFEARSIC